MQFNFKPTKTQTQPENGKFLVTLNDLIDDMAYENNAYSDMYQERGEIYDREKIACGIKTNSAGRYTNKYIQYIMRNEDLDKFQATNNNKNNKVKKKNKNGK